MLKIKVMSVAFSALLLTACTGAAVKPTPTKAEASTANPPASAGKLESVKPLVDTPALGQPVPGAIVDPAASGRVTRADFERLEGRFNLTQEQLLGLITKNAQMQQQNHRMMMMMQALLGKKGAPDSSKVVEDASVAPDYDTSAMDEVLEQLLVVANDLGAGTLAGEYRVASVYTSAGEWVLIRFNRASGETWLADGNQWTELADNEVLPDSEYGVNLVRAEKDSKGYSAVRVDRNSGRIWWLKQSSWQSYSP